MVAGKTLRSTPRFQWEGVQCFTADPILPRAVWRSTRFRFVSFVVYVPRKIGRWLRSTPLWAFCGVQLVAQNSCARACLSSPVPGHSHKIGRFVLYNVPTRVLSVPLCFCTLHPKLCKNPQKMPKTHTKQPKIGLKMHFLQSALCKKSRFAVIFTKFGFFWKKNLHRPKKGRTFAPSNNNKAV